MTTTCDADAVEISRLRAELAAAKLEAQNAAASKARFLANMSHELRTPLNAIIGFADFLLTADAISPAKARDYLGSIKEGGERLATLLENILEIAKIEGGKIEIHPEPLELGSVLAATLQLLRGKAEENGVRIDFEGTEGWVVLADESAFRRALVHIVANAVKFTAKGGHVSIVTRLDEERGLTIRVTDTGIGMKAEDIPRLMQPFTQASEDLARVYEGGGLGLPIAKALVELHDGTLDVCSKEGVGTSVTITLPFHRIEGEFGQEDATVLELDPAALPPSFSSHLALEFEDAQVRVFEGSGNCLIGRNRDGNERVRCDLTVNDQRVSRPHATVRFRENGFYIVDQSRRGTFVVDDEEGTCAFLRENEVCKLGKSGRIYLGMEPSSADARPIHYKLSSAGA
jgi:nitrogen-specific signal transduction histidine kinase